MPVRGAVTQAVEGDDPTIDREGRHLMAPVVAVDDRPGRQQQDRLVTRAELLPVDPLSRPHDIT